MKKPLSAYDKRIFSKKQHIQSMMDNIYKETSPNSKILKYLLHNPHLNLEKKENKINSIVQPSLNHRSSNSIALEGEGIYFIQKDLSIEGEKIDKIYEKSKEKANKKELHIKKLDEVLFQTLKKRQEKVYSFADLLKKEITNFYSTNLNKKKKEEESKDDEKTKKKELKLIKTQKNLHYSIKKRLEPKKSQINWTQMKFLELYKEIYTKKIKEEEDLISQKINFENQEIPSIFPRKSLEIFQSESPRSRSENISFRKDPLYLKRLEEIEKRRAFEIILQNAKSRLKEKIDRFSNDKKKKAKSMYESCTTIDKIKKKYEFLNYSKKKNEEEEKQKLLQISKIDSTKYEKKYLPTTASIKKRNKLFSLTMNQKIRIFLNDKKKLSFLEEENNKNFNQNNKKFIDENNHKDRVCESLSFFHEAAKKKTNHSMSFNYNGFQKILVKPNKSNFLLREMKKGFAEIDKTLLNYKSQLSDVPESLTINFKE